MTSNRLLVGPRVSTPQTTADHATLWRLEDLDASAGGFRGAPLDAPRHPEENPAGAQPVPPARASPSAAVTELTGVGQHAVTRVALAGGHLYAITLEATPGPGRAAGLAAFDLRTGKWLWHRADACAPDAEAVAVAAAEGVVVCGARRHYPGAGVVNAVRAQTGEPLWKLRLPTVDAVSGAGSAVIALFGDRAAVIDAGSGKLLYELESDNGRVVRAVPIAVAAPGATNRTTRVVAVEPGGVLVARDPAASGKAAWALRVAGYVRALQPARDHVAVSLSSGELVLVAAVDGKPTVVSRQAPSWGVPGGGELFFDDAHTRAGAGRLHGYGLGGAPLFRSVYAVGGPLELAMLRGDGADTPVVLVSHRGEARALVVEPRRGTLTAVHVLPPRWVRGSVFSAIVDGRPVAGVVLQKPLGVQLF